MSSHSYKSDSFYAELGGAQALRDVVERFHDIVEEDSAAEALMTLHLQGTGIMK